MIYLIQLGPIWILPRPYCRFAHISDYRHGRRASEIAILWWPTRLPAARLDLFQISVQGNNIFFPFFCELSNKLTISFFCEQGDMETCDVGHDAAVDIRSNRLAMGLWSKSFRMSGSESHNFSRLHQRRIKFRLRLLGHRSKHIGHSLGNRICLQSKLSDMLL